MVGVCIVNEGVICDREGTMYLGTWWCHSLGGELWEEDTIINYHSSLLMVQFCHMGILALRSLRPFQT
jgi:hypothetical protein